MIRFLFLSSAPILSFPGRKWKRCGIRRGAWIPLPACCHLRHTWPWSLGWVQDLWVSQIPWTTARCKPRPSCRQISHKIIVCVKDSRVVYLANGFELNSLTRLNSFHMNWQAVDQDVLGSLNSCSLTRRQPTWESSHQHCGKRNSQLLGFVSWNGCLPSVMYCLRSSSSCWIAT